MEKSSALAMEVSFGQEWSCDGEDEMQPLQYAAMLQVGQSLSLSSLTSWFWER